MGLTLLLLLGVIQRPGWGSWVFLSLWGGQGVSSLSPTCSSSVLGEPKSIWIHSFTTTTGKPGFPLSPPPLVAVGTPTYLPWCLQSALGSLGQERGKFWQHPGHGAFPKQGISKPRLTPTPKHKIHFSPVLSWIQVCQQRN